MPHTPRRPSSATMGIDEQVARPKLFGDTLDMRKHELRPEDVADRLFGGQVAVNELTGALELNGTVTERRIVGRRTTG